MSNNDLKVLGLEGTEQLVEEIKSLVAAPVGNASIIGISVTEAPDGTVTMVHTLDNGETETLVISPDVNGNPNKLTHNGIEIPITWTDNGSSGASGVSYRASSNGTAYFVNGVSEAETTSAPTYTAVASGSTT